MAVIDVHTHMYSDSWFAALKRHGGPEYRVERRPDGGEYLTEYDLRSIAFIPALFDYDLRIEWMDRMGVDISVISLTGPSVYWGGREVSAEVARVTNDEFAAAQAAHPGRIRWFATLPWEYPDLAVAELTRALAKGAAGVMVLANVKKQPLTDPAFEPIWREIDRRKLPVLVHPNVPMGIETMAFDEVRGLLPTLGYTFDTSHAIARMALTGFFDRFPAVKIIAAHGGGFLPFIAARLDLFLGKIRPELKKSELPSAVLRERVFYDAVLYGPEALHMCLNFAGADRVMFGTDYPLGGDDDGLFARARALPAPSRDGLLDRTARRVFGL
jgi:aminocarboxymuconate-semialdehyde decarboxylase